MSTAVLIWGALIAQAALGAGTGTVSVPSMPPEDGAEGDGVYGRLNGDFSGSVGVSMESDITADSFRPALSAGVRYFQAVGILLHYSQAVAGTDPLERRFTTDLVVEPLFLYRWPRYAHTGRAFFDLFVDSIGLHVGAAFLEPRGSAFASSVRFNTGLGFGLPLTGRAPGPWVRVRYDLQLDGPDPSHLVLTQLEWQFFWESPWIKRSLDRVGP